MRFRHTRVTAAAVTVIALGVAGLTAGPAQAVDGTIHGTVLAAGGTTLVDASDVCVYATSATLQVYSDCLANGETTFSISVPPGTYKIRFEDNATQRNYLDEYYDNAGQVEDSQPVPVTSGGDVLLNLTELAPAGTASGTMTGPAAAALDPSSNVCVYAFDTATVEQYAHVAGTCVDPLTGTYTLAAPPGTYKLRFEDSGRSGVPYYAPQWYDGELTSATSATVSITAGADTSLNPGTLVQAGSISGTITGPGSAQLIGAVRPNVRIDGFLYAASTNVAADGIYTITGLPSGTYKFGVEQTDYYSNQWYNNKTSSDSADPLPIAAGEHVTGRSMTLAVKSGYLPPQPRNVTVTQGNQSLGVAWTASSGPSDRPTVTYTATTSSGQSCSTTALSCTITGLTNGVSYDVTVTGRNSLGTGVDSETISYIPRNNDPAGPNGPAAPRDQVGPKVVSKVKKGKTAKLPTVTASGPKITWTSLTRKTCTVKGAKVKGTKKGKCVLRAMAAGTDTLSAFTSTYTITVKAK